MHVNKKTENRWQAVVTGTFHKLQIKQSPPTLRTQCSHAAVTSQHASQLAGCGKKGRKHGCDVNKNTEFVEQKKHTTKMDFGRLQTVKARVAPEIEKYQFHPRHGCLNPLLPFVC